MNVGLISPIRTFSAISNLMTARTQTPSSGRSAGTVLQDLPMPGGVNARMEMQSSVEPTQTGPQTQTQRIVSGRSLASKI